MATMLSLALVPEIHERGNIPTLYGPRKTLKTSVWRTVGIANGPDVGRYDPLNASGAPNSSVRVHFSIKDRGA